MPSTDVRKILILRFSSLGDIVMATAMVRCLRKAFPLAQIDMVVRQDFLQLIEQNPHLDRKLGLDRKNGWRALLELRKEINRQHYDIVYDAHRSLRTWVLMPFIIANKKLYFEKPYLRRALATTFKLKGLIRGSKRMLERYLEPLKEVGVVYDGLGPEIVTQPGQAELIFKREQIEQDPKWIGMIPSAQWPGKRWSTQNFHETLKLLIAHTNERFLIFGGPEDFFCRELAEGFSSDRVVNLQGRLTLSEVMQVFSALKCCIANDTGLMHVADAMNIPNVLIFGPTNADMGCLPFHPKSQIIEHDLWCRPCSKNGQAPCIRRKRWCLELTTPELVVQRTKTLLAQINQREL